MKQYVILLSAIATCLLLICLPASAEMIYEYALVDNHAEITSFYFDGNMPVAEFPAYIDDCPVTTIGKYAFSFLDTSFCNVGKLVLPNTLIKIEEGALSNMSSMVKQVTIPSSLSDIGDFAFCDTTTTMFLPDDHPYLYKTGAFLVEKKTQKAVYCEMTEQNAAAIEVPEGILILGTSLFDSWTALEKVILPQSLIEIGDCAFFGCMSLTQIVIPDNVKRINYWAFRECYELSEIDLPAGLLYIGQESFAGCSSLTELICPDELKVIEAGAFMQLDLTPEPGLRNLVLNDGLLYIGIDAFNGNQLETADFPDSIKYIGKNAFANNLAHINLGSEGK